MRIEKEKKLTTSMPEDGMAGETTGEPAQQSQVREEKVGKLG
jgi:hypothetical protein